MNLTPFSVGAEEDHEIEMSLMTGFMSEIAQRRYPDPKNAYALSAFADNLLTILFSGELDFQSQEMVLTFLQGQPHLIANVQTSLELHKAQVSGQIAHLKSLNVGLTAKKNQLVTTEHRLQMLMHRLISEVATEKSASNKPFVIAGGRKFTATETPGSAEFNEVELVPEKFMKLEPMPRNEYLVKDGVVYKVSPNKVEIAKHLRKQTGERTDWATLKRKKKVDIR